MIIGRGEVLFEKAYLTAVLGIESWLAVALDVS